ncbi:unnamed protein product [Spirodela intermedia]|uniref:Uncharacterized protein n=1 Tax=Spirodela intermedia TaxID=51605 RepID=A0A7I8KIC6_SPIIN|nr:unnamed protein product [Spirodela intermedia]
MSERRGRGRPPLVKYTGHREDTTDDEVTVLEPPLSETDLCRLQLRGRWELASVLNFLHVFQPIILSELKISAEEMEIALMTAGNVLAHIHITLLKGIPPVSKNLEESDAWVTVLCKKLKMWWPWVAEGEVPLVANNGVEILTYKGLDPMTRLLILKALCEIRMQQDDILSYVDEGVKRGGQLSKFRKDSIYQDGNGTTYWYDGDSVIGHRLYKNVPKVEYKPKPKGRGRLTQPRVTFQWETLATNLKEFQQIADKLLCSKISSEHAIGSIVKDEIMPVVEELEKKKERLLKRRQRQATLFEGLRNCNFIQSRRSCRERRPVSYTFDEYYESIDEAIQDENGEDQLSSSWMNSHPLELLYRKRKMSISKKDDDEGDSTAEATDQDHSENSVQTSAERPKDGHRKHEGWDEACGGRGDMGWLEMRKRLRERPTANTGYNPNVRAVPDGDGGRRRAD